MNKNLKYFIIVLLFLFVVLYLMQQMKDTETQTVETLTFSQFQRMLTPQGQKDVGKKIYSPYGLPEPDANFLGIGAEPIQLTITEKKISGYYLDYDREIHAEESQNLERIQEIARPFVVEVLPGTVSDELKQKLSANNLDYRLKNEEEGGFLSAITWYLPIILLIVLFWMFMMRQIQSTGNRALAFGKSKARLNQDDKNKVTFNDVAGCDEAKVELQEVVDFLKDPRRFQAIGAKIPKGVLLVGPPGTGKTLLARAIAGEAGVPFYSISGSDFVEMFVGVGASRVRDLFEQAKKNSPCIVFVDEIDAVGRLRGAGLGGGHDEREQTLNQMLVEMDGFEENEGVIIIAATNRPDVLDPALLRPGRFDRQVVVDTPDVKGREEILRIHGRKIPVTSDVSWQQIARGTPGFTGADLANLINEAALLAARRSKKRVTMDELEEAKDKVMMGPERRSFLMTPKDKEVTAYHEAGHALLGTLLPYTEPVHKVTIIPRGRALGLTMQLPEEDTHYHPRKYWEDRICVYMGGYLAEDLTFGDTSTGASDDIKQATRIARHMVCEWGMSNELGTISYASDNDNVFLGREMGSSRNYSDVTASTIDQEVRRIVEAQLKRGRELLTENKDKLSRLAKALLSSETVTGEQLKALVNGTSEPSASTSEGSLPGGGLDPAPAT